MRKSSLCGLTLPPSEMRETSIGGSQSMKMLPFHTCNSPLSVRLPTMWFTLDYVLSALVGNIATEERPRRVVCERRK
ncbi:hypothetical protein MRB53_036532 [Persea americana]|nr:hypothetical protein MRB53_036810 [Persea americana]KAJ8614666.1 hypothetical protein MRB53_036532 [Persea americana]